MMKDPMDKFKAVLTFLLPEWCILHQAPMTESMSIGWHEEEAHPTCSDCAS